MAIKCLVTDFDGVMTDGSVYVDQEGRESVCCSRLDGIAIRILKQKGVRVLILSSESSGVVKARGEKLGVETHAGVQNKEAFLKLLINGHSYSKQDIAYVGDEVNDIKCFELVGYSYCPADAHISVQGIVSKKLRTPGGRGVIREIVNLLYPDADWPSN